MGEKHIVLVSGSPGETRSIGERIGRRLGEGDVVALSGELGSGKTCLIQGIARGLGIDTAVPVNSPSYVIVNEYPGPLPLYHFDLYRLYDLNEIYELGWDDYAEKRGVIVIEWAERAGPLLPPGRIDVRLEVTGENSRRITIFFPSGVSPDGKNIEEKHS